jgi:general secretion pathway protein G
LLSADGIRHGAVEIVGRHHRRRLVHLRRTRMLIICLARTAMQCTQCSRPWCRRGKTVPTYCGPMSLTPPLSAPARRPQRGFTLIEIMVVITILGILAALIVPRVVGRTDDARIAAAKQDIASLLQALKLYRLDNGAYPTTEQGLRALLAKPTIEPLPQNWKQGGYLERSSMPKDPWGNEYKYLNPGLRGEIDVFSYGRDGAPGGEGVDADIGSWQL